MAMIEKKSEIEEVKDDEQAKNEVIYRVFPDIHRRVDYDNYKVEVENDKFEADLEIAFPQLDVHLKNGGEA